MVEKPVSINSTGWARATGLIGGHCLECLLSEDAYDRVVVLTRRATGIDHPKLQERVTDFGRLADQIAAAEEGGADLMHLDVMDGRFVPAITFGPLVVAAVRRATRLPIEAHLMVADPASQLAPMAEAGAERLIPHLEAKQPSKVVLPPEIRCVGSVR